MAILLTRRAAVLAALETTYNVAVTPNPLTDALLVENPDFVADETVLVRNFARTTLSPLPHIIGRKLAKVSFTTELRGNGLEQSGLVANAPVIARLFQACGYALTGVPAASASPVFDCGIEPNEVAWVTGGTHTNTDVIAYYIMVDTAGPSGTAHVTVTSDTIGENSPSQVVTSGTPLSLGTKGLTVTPTFAGSLTAGQRWAVWALPKGLRLDPISLNFPSLTMQVFYDGTMHLLTGCLGTFTMDAMAGQYATLKWEFTGQYYQPTDTPMPTCAFETTLPAPVQLARLNIDGFGAVVDKVTMTQGNDIQPRPNVSATDGYSGVRLVARKPEMGIDPEADLVGNHDFWGRLAAAVEMPFQMRVGSAVGNTVWLLAPNAQYMKMTYKDRQGIRTYDAALNLAAYSADDEICFFFC